MSTSPLLPLVVAILLAGCLGSAVERESLEPALEPASGPGVPPPATGKGPFEFAGAVVTPVSSTKFIFKGHATVTAGAAPRALVVEAAWTCAAPPQCSGILYVVDPADEIRAEITGRGSARGVIELTDEDKGEWRVVPRPAESVVQMRGSIAVTAFYEAPPDGFTAL